MPTVTVTQITKLNGKHGKHAAVQSLSHLDLDGFNRPACTLTNAASGVLSVGVCTARYLLRLGMTSASVNCLFGLASAA